MDHPCYKCGALVEDGVAFCPHCQAPQIRVAMEAPAADYLQTQGEVLQSPGSAPIPAGAIQWGQALPAAAMAGFVAATLMLVPLGGVGLGMIVAGGLAVLLYRRRVAAADVSAGAGAKLGAASGAIGFSFFAIFTAVEVLVFHTGGEINAAMLQAVNQAAARSNDPQARQAIEYLKTPQGLALVAGLGLVVMLLAFLIFSSLGGAIGAALLRSKQRK